MENSTTAILKFDYEKTLEAVNKFDDQIFRIRAWALTTCAATVAYSISNAEQVILIGTVVLCVSFYLLEIITKSFHEDCIGKCYKLETLIQSSLDTEFSLPENYEFGLGHAIKEVTPDNLTKIFFNKKRWHIRSTYWGILFLTTCSYAYLSIFR